MYVARALRSPPRQGKFSSPQAATGVKKLCICIAVAKFDARAACLGPLHQVHADRVQEVVVLGREPKVRIEKQVQRQVGPVALRASMLGCRKARPVGSIPIVHHDPGAQAALPHEAQHSLGLGEGLLRAVTQVCSALMLVATANVHYAAVVRSVRSYDSLGRKHHLPRVRNGCGRHVQRAHKRGRPDLDVASPADGNARMFEVRSRVEMNRDARCRRASAPPFVAGGKLD